MIRRPPRSTLFPYTRSSDLCRFGNGPIPLYRLRATKNRILDQRGNYWDYVQLYLRALPECVLSDDRVLDAQKNLDRPVSDLGRLRHETSYRNFHPLPSISLFFLLYL